MGAAMVDGTATAAKSGQQDLVLISPRLKHAVELAAREHGNGYQLTGGVRPWTQSSHKNIQALQTLRGSYHALHNRVLH
jgi:hypothetical protein